MLKQREDVIKDMLSLLAREASIDLTERLPAFVHAVAMNAELLGMSHGRIR